MGCAPSKQPTFADIQTFFVEELTKPGDLNLEKPIRITGYGPVPAGDEKVLHQRLKGLVRDRGIYVDTCTVRAVDDYDALRKEVLSTAIFKWEITCYKPPYDWVAEIRLRKSYVLQHKAYQFTVGTLIHKA